MAGEKAGANCWRRTSTANCRWTPRSCRKLPSRKLPDSKVAGRANVLIFPDLNSGNIASKLVQHVAARNAYGQILLGLDRPAADVSRGSSAHDILGVAAIIGVQSTEYQKFYPGAGAKLPGEGTDTHEHLTTLPRVFIAATRQNDGKTTTSLGLIAALQKHLSRASATSNRSASASSKSRSKKLTRTRC